MPADTLISWDALQYLPDEARRVAWSLRLERLLSESPPQRRRDVHDELERVSLLPPAQTATVAADRLRAILALASHEAEALAELYEEVWAEAPGRVALRQRTALLAAGQGLSPRERAAIGARLPRLARWLDPDAAPPSGLRRRDAEAARIAARYPHHTVVRAGWLIDVALVGDDDHARLRSFTRAFPEADLLALRWDVTDPLVIDAWLTEIYAGRATTVRASDAEGVIGVVTLFHDTATWTRHRGELQVLVHPADRRHGLGRRLVAEGLWLAETLGLRQVWAQICTGSGAAELVASLGFQPVATIPAAVMDTAGATHDLCVVERHLDHEAGAEAKRDPDLAGRAYEAYPPPPPQTERPFFFQ